MLSEQQRALPATNPEEVEDEKGFVVIVAHEEHLPPTPADVRALAKLIAAQIRALEPPETFAAERGEELE
jgi:hypothetical protein